jgi:Ni,Fe-hydrogenase maturation factor
VLIVDAVVPRRATAPDAQPSGVQLQRLHGGPDPSWSSHALSPAALLQLCTELCEPAQVPPVWLLGIEAEQFELGAPLSAAARRRLDQALVLARAWLAAQGVAAA